ncbi:hypothetical protein N431DRAFT_135363 [Stipitochalara longipes BDJ]|nr:hypothetical protein N431DRAFT_135363 [Stipitochalara longipes BDJ]
MSRQFRDSSSFTTHQPHLLPDPKMELLPPEAPDPECPNTTILAENPEASETKSEPYRFDFGRYQGKLLDECPPDYLEWITKKNIPTTRPNLREALAEFRTRLTPPKTMPTATTSSTIACDMSAKPYVKYQTQTPRTAQDAGNFILAFGKYKGIKISEVNRSYLEWLSTSTFDPGADCRAAVRSYLSSPSSFTPATSSSPLPRLQEKLDLSRIIKAPPRFRDRTTNGYIWIKQTDAKQYFDLSDTILNPRVVPDIDFQNSAPHDPRYWLFTVWDLARIHKGRVEADKVLGEILDKRESLEDELWKKMGMNVRDAIILGLERYVPIPSPSQPPRSEAISIIKTESAPAHLSPPGKPCSKSLGPNFVLTFGKHEGKRLSDVPESYLYWLIDNTSPTSQLSTALYEIGITPAISGPRKAGWSPPYTGSAPYQFYDDYSEEALWISQTDARQYFGLGANLLEGLPVVGSSRSALFKSNIPRYWLYHIWDLRRVMTSRVEANAALRAFSDKNEEAFDGICDSMGLGAGLC